MQRQRRLGAQIPVIVLRRPKRSVFLDKAGNHALRVAKRLLLAPEIGNRLRQPLVQFLAPAFNPALFLIKLLRSRPCAEALRRGSLPARAGPAASRPVHRGGADSSEAARVCSASMRVVSSSAAASRFAAFRRLFPGHIKAGRFKLADFGGNHFVFLRLPRLPLQAFDLAFELRRSRRRAASRFCSAALQPQFRLMAARMQAGNAGRFFEHARGAPAAWH